MALDFLGIARKAVARETRSAALSGDAWRLFELRGWTAVRSRIIGEVVIFCRDKRAPVPARYEDRVRYTLDELRKLTGTRPNDLQLIHEIKRVFDGTVIR